MLRKSGVIYLILFSLLVLTFSCRGNKGTEKNWKYVGEIKDEKGNGVQVFMDMANLEIDGNKRNFWIRYMAVKDPKTGEKYIRQTGYWEIDCFDMTLYRLGEEYYNPEGKLLGKSEKRVREEYSSYESLGAKMSDVACRYAGK
ncbi:MAG: surface-adhesin E family protein [Thermodesulfobacteriota bacterium]